MTDPFLFSKPFTFLACAGMAEVREGIEALDTLPGHLHWLDNEDTIRREHVPAFLEQSRVALETLLPGGVELIDSLVTEIRRSPRLLPELRQLDAEALAAGHSYCYWRYASDVVGRARGIPRSALERQFDRSPTRLDGAHKLQWNCPCCQQLARYQVDGLVASQRPARQGGFSLECDHCGHQERLYAGFLHLGRLECRCAVCTRFVETLARQMVRPARKLSASLEGYAWAHAADTLAEVNELKEESLQMLARRGRPSANAMTFAMAALQAGPQSLPAILGQIDPTLDGKLEKNPRAWALLCELLGEGVLDSECEIYDQDGRQHVALEISLLDDAHDCDVAATHECLNTLLNGYAPAERGSFVNWLKALKRLRLCGGRFNAAVDVKWKPNPEHCRILTAEAPDRSDASRRAAGVGSPMPAQGVARLGRPAYLDAELEAVQLLRSLGYIVLSPEQIRSQQDSVEGFPDR
ncbi:hypothetical protein [Cupriavidus campinensis]